MPQFHLKMMRAALAEARRGLGKTAPNPVVGCLIVRDGAVVGRGWHKKAGTPHAEVHALHQAGELAAGADVYVTLEPCAHFGKTPPCARALVAAGVARVFVAMVDPNPLVAGKGIAILREAGIEVQVGLLEAAAREINLPFIKWMETKRPYVILKSALTMDGKSATAGGDSRWITGDRSRREVHRLRGVVDAIMVGVGTVVKDDPLLTCRVPGGKDPIRIVVDSTLRMPRHAAVFNPHSKARTIVATCSRDATQLAAVVSHGGEILACDELEGRVDLDHLFSQLGELGIQSILLEGGSHLAGAALRAGLIDRCLIFLAPKLVGGVGMGLFAGQGVAMMGDALRLEDMTVKRIGADLLVQGTPVLPVAKDSASRE
jgi:diaminohydroxyphosphoribosylaminopyrimidine deaminase / 5-amino-6-(5-phosphoribosylamino)uracil reductase